MILREIKNIFIKNRLTEGVDFVRKEWLKGNGIAYINFPDTVAFSIKIKEIDTNITNYARGYKLNTDRLLRLYVGKGGSTTNCSGLVIYNAATGHVSTNYRSPISDIGLGEHIITKTDETDRIGVFTDGVRHRKNASTDIAYIGTDLIFNQLIPNSNLYICYLMSISLNLTPCQLLKSIPATLDANNIARSAGECGMYDSISGKFYGNVADSGTFTVEGEVEPETHTGLQQIYQNKLIEGVDYETYDWLKGEGIINYDKPIDYLSDNLMIKIRNLDSNSGYNTIWVGGETNPGKNDWSRCIIDFEVVNGVAERQVQWCEYVYRNGYYQHFPTSSDNIYTFDIDINRAIINGVTYNMTSSRCNITTPFVITLRKADSIAYCKLNNVDMYPCQLLRSIPRNLDAQCKERQAGECGMIDLISGKFYGNVANSGTFTVENDTENNE